MISYKIVFLGTMIGVLPFVFWFFLLKKRKITADWDFNFILLVIFIGVLSAIPASLLQIFFIETGSGVMAESSSSAIIPLLLFSLVEEFSKGLGIFFIAKKKLGQFAGNGILIGIFVGLAFAITENGVYFSNLIKSQSDILWQIVLLRFIISTTAHIVYSGLMGYFIQKIIFAKNAKFFFVLGAGVIPFLIHFLFNYFLEIDYSWLSVLIIFVGIFFLFNFHTKDKQTIYE